MVHKKLLDFLDTYVFELCPHGFACVQLQANNAFKQGELGIIVREIQNQAVVQIVLNVIALGNDDHVIPVVQLEQLLECCLVNQCVRHLLLGLRGPHGFFADQADATTSAPLVIDESRDIRELVLVANTFDPRETKAVKVR